MSFHPHGCCNPLNCGCFWAVLFWAKLSQNSENDSSEDSKVDNHLEKIHFADLVKDTKSVAGFCPSHQFQLLQAEQRSRSMQLKLSHHRTHEGHVTLCGYKYGNHQCTVRGQTCHKCRQKNHFQSMCRSANPKVNAVDEVSRTFLT